MSGGGGEGERISHEIFLLLVCISAFDDAYHVQSLSTVTYSVSPIKTHLRLEVPRRFVNYINSSEHATLFIHSYPSNRELSTSSTTFKPKHFRIPLSLLGLLNSRKILWPNECRSRQRRFRPLSVPNCVRNGISRWCYGHRAVREEDDAGGPDPLLPRCLLPLT